MINIYYKTEDDAQFIEIAEPRDGAWIHIEEATNEDIEQISELTELDETDLHDALDRYEIPRIERVKEDVLIFTRHPIPQDAGLYTTTFTIILTKQYFITISPQKCELIQKILSKKSDISPAQKSNFLIYILLRITQDFTHQIKRIRSNVLRQEKKMSYVESRDITMLAMSEEILNQYLSSLVPFRNVLEAITSGKYTILYEKDQDLLEDLLNASIQSEDLCNINLNSIRSLRDSYQIIFTNQLNKTIKLLTALTIILSIPTMIASLYGMNVSLPIEKNPNAFPIIMLIIIVLSFVSLIIFQRKRWL